MMIKIFEITEVKKGNFAGKRLAFIQAKNKKEARDKALTLNLVPKDTNIVGVFETSLTKKEIERLSVPIVGGGIKFDFK